MNTYVLQREGENPSNEWMEIVGEFKNATAAAEYVAENWLGYEIKSHRDAKLWYRDDKERYISIEVVEYQADTHDNEPTLAWF